MAKPSTQQSAEVQACIERFDRLIDEKNIDGLLPFLQNEAHVTRPAFRKHVVKLHRYLTEYVEFEHPQIVHGRLVKWGQRGDYMQLTMATLTQVAVLTTSDKSNFWNELAMLNAYSANRNVREVVQWAKPTWIVPMLEKGFDDTPFYSFDYKLLRTLETEGIVTFSPKVFAKSLGSPRWLKEEKEVAEVLLSLENDHVFIERDLPLLFDYETVMFSSWIKSDNPAKPVLFWNTAFLHLLSEGKLDRREVLEKSLQVQTKDWDKALKLFFRTLIDNIGPTETEWVGQQHTLFTFLHESTAQLVNYGMEKIKLIHKHTDFDLTTCLSWLPPVLIRQDLAPAIKKALQIFDYFFKNAPENRLEMLLAAADVLVVPNMELQEQAAKRIIKYGQSGDTALVEKLESYLPQMQGNVRQNLASAFGISENTETADSFETVYHIDLQPHKLLVEKVTTPENWNDILFLISRYLSGRAPLDAEIFLHTYHSKQHILPRDSGAQLQPLFKQIVYWPSPQQTDIDSLMNGFLLQDQELLNELDAEPESLSGKIRILAPHIFKHLMRIARQKAVRRSALPLLCFPTHQPYWVDPKTLVQRLLDYQAAKEPIDWLDLIIAISRMPRENVEEAIALVPKLDPELRPLLEFCLGTSTDIRLRNEGLKSKLLSFLRRVGDDTAQLAAWAVAARTYNSDGYFPEFEKTSFADVPNVMKPFSAEIGYVRHPKREEPPRWKGAKSEVIPAHTDLVVALPSSQFYPMHLLYSVSLAKGFKKEWQWITALPANCRFWHSLIPQYPEPLVWYHIMTKTGLKTLLEVLSRPEYRWTPPSIVAFAMAFYDGDKAVRFTAGELLHGLIEENRLQSKQLGKQLGDFVYARYGALTRLAECLERVKDVSPKHNAALFDVLDSLFARFYECVKEGQDESLPTHLKKLVEYYVDVQVKTRRNASAGARECFKFLEGNATLKKLVSQVLTM